MYDIVYYDYKTHIDYKLLLPELLANTRTEWVWCILKGTDVSDLNLRFIPPKGQENQIHVWGLDCNPQHYAAWLVPANLGYLHVDINVHEKLLDWDSETDIGWVWQKDLRTWWDHRWLPDTFDCYNPHIFKLKNIDAATCWLYNPHVKFNYDEKYHDHIELEVMERELDTLYPIKYFDYTESIDYKEIIPKLLEGETAPYVWCVLDNYLDNTPITKLFTPDYSQREHVFVWGTEGNPKHYCIWLVPNNNNMRFEDREINIRREYYDIYIKHSGGYGWKKFQDCRYGSHYDWLPDTFSMNKYHVFRQPDGSCPLWYCNDSASDDLPVQYHFCELPLRAKDGAFLDLIYYDYKETIDPYDIIEKNIIKANDEWVWFILRGINWHDDEELYPDTRMIPDFHNREDILVWGTENNPKHYAVWLVPNNNNIPLRERRLCIQPERVKVDVSQTGWEWTTDERIDYSEWDFNWLPDSLDQYNPHVFTLGKNDLSYTLLTNPHIGESLSAKKHQSNLRFTKKYADHIHWDMGNGPVNVGADHVIRYIGTHESMIASSVKRATQEWLWITSSCCDYDDFDFTWLPDEHQKHYIHCWASGTCKKGDTFLVHVPTYMHSEKHDFNFISSGVKRILWPIVDYSTDSLAEAIVPSKSLYTLYTNNCRLPILWKEPCLWDKRPVIGLNRSHSISLVPRDCVVEKELYEYPYLDEDIVFDDQRPSVIFISNGESVAHDNYYRAYEITNGYMTWISNVNGRLASYQEAAEASKTPWFIAVFAKCYLLDTFKNFDWVPDYWQEPKHYIFYNRNLNNGLIYGHQAPIAYNKKLMLENTGGLDMTLAQKHEVVPRVVSQTVITGDPWLIWRTAFREVIKILYYSQTDPSVENAYRLHCWKTVSYANSKDDTWQFRGAKDAQDFFDRCGGELHWLMLSSEWKWCRDYFEDLYRAEITV